MILYLSPVTSLGLITSTWNTPVPIVPGSFSTLSLARSALLGGRCGIAFTIWLKFVLFERKFSNEGIENFKPNLVPALSGSSTGSLGTKPRS